MEVVIVFCSNCGSKLADGAKFCSECGARIEDIQVRPFDTQAFKESVGVSGAGFEESVKTEKAFQDRVSFDWSNVIDEPQKKEVPQEIKSPWAATSGSINERELYAEMTQSDDKSRTMDFIDILKADREEREKAAFDKSIEYTEVLELDPEVAGGTKPPKLRYAPLYDDVDAPVTTPFDNMPEPAEEAVPKDTTSYEAPAADIPKEAATPEKKHEVRREAPKFEIPDFLKKAVNFGAKNEEPEVIPKAEVEEPIFEEDTIEEAAEAAETVEALKAELEKTAEAELEKAAAVELEKAAEAELEKEAEAEIEKAAAAVLEKAAEEELEKAAEAEVAKAAEAEIEKAVVESAVEEALDDSAENLYLDEDLYLDIDENSSGNTRMSRVDAHTLAGMYDESDLDDYDEDDEEETYTNIDEKELFTEMSETPAGHTGMTIAAPADEEAEIEALKRRLAELTGAVDMRSAASPEPEVTPEPLKEAEAPEGSFESLGSDFKFEPEVTKAEEELFAGLKPAREASVEDAYLEVKTPEVKTPEVETPKAESPKLEDFAFEPEVTEKDNELFEALTPASSPAEETIQEVLTAEALRAEEPKVEPKSFGLDFGAEPAAAEPVYEAPKAEDLKFEAPAPEISDSQKEAFDKLVFDFPQTEKASADSSAAVLEAAASAIKEEPKMPEFVEPEFEIPAAEPARGLAADTEVPAAAKAVPVIKETPVSLGLEPKVTDAVSLEELENDLFGELPNDSEPETTKKIDKFYTLYRKNEEFQRLLDEEYSRLKGENIDVPKSETTEAAASSVPSSLEAFASRDAGKAAEKIEEPAAKAENQAEATAAILEELAGKSRPVEDATIYKVGMPEEAAQPAVNAEAQAADTGFSVGGNAVQDSKVGLDGTEAAAAAAAAAGAGAVVSTMSKKEAKKAEKEAKKAARKAAKAAKTADPQVEYEEVDGGSTFLTVLAVLIAILLVVLLAVILILHIAPNSGPAMAIDGIIERLTSGASSLSSLGGIKWL